MSSPVRPTDTAAPLSGQHPASTTPRDAAVGAATLERQIHVAAVDHVRASRFLSRASLAIIVTLGAMASMIALGLARGGIGDHLAIDFIRLGFLTTTVGLIAIVVALRSRLALHVRRSAINHDLLARQNDRLLEQNEQLERQSLALQVLTRRLTEAQRVARLGYWEMATATREVFWSEELYRVFGLEPSTEPPPNERVMALLHPDDQGRMLAVFRRAAYDLVGFSEQYRMFDGNGATRVMQATGSVIIDECGVQKVVGTVQDVTERVELEAQLRQAQKMEAIGQLAGGVAHDFNNVLTVIDGYGALIGANRQASEETRSYAKEIRGAAKRAATLTRQLLAFSRKQEVRPTTLDLNETISATSNMLRRLIGEHIELHTNLVPSAEPITADPVQIEQILMNLAVNARDAMADGGMLIVQTSNLVLDAADAERRGVAAGAYVLLAVTDSGTGMDAATRARIFEPFFTTKPVGQGTGLGLATVYAIVSHAGGHIDVQSEPGRGTTFNIYFPSARTPCAVADVEQRDGLAAGGGEWVLLVEDDDALRPLTSRVLRSSGYNVIEACDGREALELSEQVGSSVALLVADVVMPGANGYEVAREITAQWPDIKVLLMSGYTPDVITNRERLASNATLLEKPFTPDTLVAAVRQALETPHAAALSA